MVFPKLPNSYSLVGTLISTPACRRFSALRTIGNFSRSVAVEVFEEKSSETSLTKLAEPPPHPNIATLFADGYLANGKPYRVTEPCQVIAFGKLAANEHLPLSVGLAQLDKICAAVTHLHQHGLFHGEHLAEHIGIDARGELKVLGPFQKITYHQKNGGSDQNPIQTDLAGLGRLLEKLGIYLPLDRKLVSIAAKARGERPCQLYSCVSALRKDLKRLHSLFLIESRPKYDLSRAIKWLQRHFLMLSSTTLVALCAGHLITHAGQQQLLNRQSREAARAGQNAEETLRVITETLELADPSNSKGQIQSQRQILETLAQKNLSNELLGLKNVRIQQREIGRPIHNQTAMDPET